MYTPSWNELKAPRGFLFIGDPHVSSVAPGRRVDDYLTTVLGKLEVAARICWEKKLIPVLLGDLIHRDNESSIAMLSRLNKGLRKFPCMPIELDGNHGKRQFRPTEGDMEHLLQDIGSLWLVQSPGLVGEFVFDGVAVKLYGCPHEDALPTVLPANGDDAVNILITHHDLAFEDGYPGAKPVLEIANCSMLVNGHMHKTMPSLQVGQMRAHNPGNIEPLSLDVIDHVPSVWEWSPEQLDFELVQHVVPHDSLCFDLTGVQVDASEDAQGAVDALKESQFAVLLAGEVSLDAHRTNDGTVLLEDLDVVCETARASEVARSLLSSLIRKATEGTADDHN